MAKVLLNGEVESVLLIEDKTSYAEEVAELLEGAGIGLVHVDTLDGGDVQELLRKDWLCILLDLKMPPYEGKATVKRARQLTTNSILVLTGLDKNDYEVEIIAAGADDYLLKHSLPREHLIRSIKIASARHIRRIDEDESARQLKAQMQVLTQLVGLMTDIKALLSPTAPFWKDFFRRLADPKERKEIGEQIKGVGWFFGRVALEVAAIVTALKLYMGEASP